MASAARTFGLIMAIAAGVGLAGVAYEHLGEADHEDGAPEMVTASLSTAPIELADIEVTTVAPQTVTSDVRISGALYPVRKTTLTAKVAGTIEAVNADVGMAVKAGDVLVELDTETLDATLLARQSSLEATQAQLRLAESVWERNRRLGESGIASQAALLDAEAQVLNLRAQVKALEAEVTQARIQIADAVIRAPFDGVVSMRSVEPGQSLAANTEVMGLVDPSRMEADVAVPTSRIAGVAIGQPARLAVDGFDAGFDGEVVRISPIAEDGSRAVRVFLSVPNEDGRLRGGMFATGTLRTGEFTDIVALPPSAIRQDGEGQYVLTAEDGRLVRRAVSLGQSWPDRNLVEVADGVEAGDVVVTAPLPDLQPDVDVRIAGL